MNIAIRYSILASLYCLAPVLVHQDRHLPDGIIGTMRRVRVVPLYIISLGNLGDKATFWHEVWHIRVKEWPQNAAQEQEVEKLRKACRNVVNDEPELSRVLREIYDISLDIDGRDEAIVLTMERPDLSKRLLPDENARLHCIKRAPLLDVKTYWFLWLVIVSVLFHLVHSAQEFGN